MAANAIGDHYPNLREDPNRLVAAYGSPQGMMVLAHLSAVMYSYWDAAPSGPSAFELATEHLLEPVKSVCQSECTAWGSRRLNSPVGDTVFIMEDTPDGSIVADHTMTKFYKVLGLKSSPATAISRANIGFPAAVRLTALPFRGVLVYDGLLGGRPQAVDGRTADKLRTAYAKVKRAGKIITGFHAEDEGRRASASVPERSLSDLSTEERSQVDRLRAASKKDDMVVFRRMGYTESENPNHLVILMWGALACGSFMSRRLTPSKEEVLRELVKLIESSGGVPKNVAMDDKDVARAVNEVTKHADVVTGFYPRASPEETVFHTTVPPGMTENLREFDGTSVPSGGVCAQQ